MTLSSNLILDLHDIRVVVYLSYSTRFASNYPIFQIWYKQESIVEIKIQIYTGIKYDGGGTGRVINGSDRKNPQVARATDGYCKNHPRVAQPMVESLVILSNFTLVHRQDHRQGYRGLNRKFQLLALGLYLITILTRSSTKGLLHDFQYFFSAYKTLFKVFKTNLT